MDNKSQAIVQAYEKYARVTVAARTAYYAVLRAAYRSYRAEVRRINKRDVGSEFIG